MPACLREIPPLPGCSLQTASSRSYAFPIGVPPIDGAAGFIESLKSRHQPLEIRDQPESVFRAVGVEHVPHAATVQVYLGAVVCGPQRRFGERRPQCCDRVLDVAAADDVRAERMVE